MYFMIPEGYGKARGFLEPLLIGLQLTVGSIAQSLDLVCRKNREGGREAFQRSCAQRRGPEKGVRD